MMRLSMLHCVCLLLAGSAVGVHTQQSGQTRFSVLVTQTGTDPIGVRLSYEIKQEMARSSRMIVTDSTKQAQMMLLLTTKADRCFDDDTTSSDVSAIFLMHAPDDTLYYENNWLLNVGQNRISDSAKYIVAEVDKSFERGLVR